MHSHADLKHTQSSVLWPLHIVPSHFLWPVSTILLLCQSPVHWCDLCPYSLIFPSNAKVAQFCHLYFSFYSGSSFVTVSKTNRLWQAFKHVIPSFFHIVEITNAEELLFLTPIYLIHNRCCYLFFYPLS